MLTFGSLLTDLALNLPELKIKTKIEYPIASKRKSPISNFKVNSIINLSMKIGYITTFMSEFFKGPIYYQLQELSKHCNVTWFSSSEKSYQYYAGRIKLASQKRKISSSLNVKRFDISFRVKGLVFPKNLTQVLQNENLDLIHSNEYYQPISWQGLRVAREKNLPFVFTQRRPNIPKGVFGLGFKILNRIGKNVVYESDAIETLSSAGKKLLLEKFPKLDESKITIIHNSIDTKWFTRRNGKRFKERYGIPKNKKIILNFSRIFPVKRIDLMIKIFAHVKKDVDDAYLIIAGAKEKNEERKILNLIQKLNLKKDVKITGIIPNEYKNDALDSADIFCLTSQEEPFGYILLEAMACKKPCIAFKVGGIPDIIQNNVNGTLIDFNDLNKYAEKIVELLTNERKRKQMGERAKEITEKKFSIQEATKKRLKIYNKLL